jgi:NAD(P)-dependent dehydrogenase (short-subunit alcohol dehydrogenase family)
MNIRRVLVTGARGSLGSVVMKKYIDAGAKVFGADLPGQLSVKGGEFIPIDLSDSKSVTNAVKGLEVDVLVHCAGGFRFAMIDQTSDADMDFLWNANCRSAFLLAREVLPSMKEKNFGRMVFVSARATTQPGAGVGAYAASKAGLNMLVGSLADEVKDFNINVNAVLPSIIDNPTNRIDMPQADFNKWVRPDQLSEIIFSLTSEWGNPINGALLPVSGRA